MARGMRLARALTRAALLVLVLVVAAAGGLLVLSQTAAFRQWLRGVIVEQAASYINGELSIGRLDGNLFTGVSLHEVELRLEGQPFLQLQAIDLRYNVWQIIASGVSIDSIQIEAPRVWLVEDARGWNAVRLVKQQAEEAEREGPARPIRVDSIQVRGGELTLSPAQQPSSFRVPQRISSLRLDASLSYAPVDISARIDTLTFATSAPDAQLRSLTGAIDIKDEDIAVHDLALAMDGGGLAVDGMLQHYLSAPRIGVRVRSDRLPLTDLARFVPVLEQVTVDASTDLTVDGPLAALNVKGNVSSTAGSIRTALTADAEGPQYGAAGTFVVERLNLAPFTHDPSLASDITADARVDVKVADPERVVETLTGSVAVNATATVGEYRADRLDATVRVDGGRADIEARLAAYRAEVTVAGQVRALDGLEAAGFDLHGTTRRVNLAALPLPKTVPTVSTDIAGRFRASGRQELGSSSRRSSRYAIQLVLDDSSLPGVRLGKDTTLEATVAGKEVAYRADAVVQRLDLREIGDAFNVTALQDPRLESDITGRVRVDGSGTSLPELAADVSASIERAAIAGGTVSDLSLTAGIRDERATVHADGRFAGFDPAALTGREEARGTIGGEMSVEATIDGVSIGVTLDNIAGAARLSLDAPTIGDLRFDTATADVSYADQTATVHSLEIAGRDAHLTASGTLAAGDSGDSHLEFKADSPRLGEIGKVAGLPLEGIARVTGTVTGNRTALAVAGTLEGDGLSYEENGALSLRAAYEATIPDLDAARAKVSTKASATFVTVAGQNINELETEATYAERRVDFDLKASQPQRTLESTGRVVLHTDHQEVHLERLAMETAGQRWEVPAGESATINYGGQAIDVDSLRLVNGTQEIRASGRLGDAGDRLDLSLSNIELSSVEALLLRPPQFGGRLDATIAATGALAAPAVQGRVDVVDGTFRDFTYQRLGADIDYTPARVTLDARLQQNETQWLTVKGRVPGELLGSKSQTADDGAPAQEIDLTVDSSPLGLGLIQGFTTAVSNVRGTFEAHARVRGTPSAPRPEGRIAIADGAMKVEATGVSYGNINGVIDLEPDRVRIEQITVLDSDHSALSITGDLAMAQRSVSGLQVYVNAEDFKVLSNEMGNLSLQTAMELSGTLSGPSIRGYLGVNSGRIDLDEVIAALGASPYDTAPTEYLTTPQDGDAEQEREPSLLDGLTVDVTLMVPEALVIRADNLQTPGATVGLGALNVTLGGDLVARKTVRSPLRLTGEINTVRGTYDFQGRRFEILRDGTIRFDGGDRLNPTLDVRTRREIQGVEARVNVRGTVDRPEILLSSTPPLEEADILSLIVFNQPINQLGTGEQVSLAARAQSMAAGVVVGQLAQSLGGALNLDTFEINLGASSGAAAEVTLGQQLGRALYLKVQQSVGDVSTTNVIVEYAFARWLRLQSNYLQGQGSTQAALFRRNQGSGVDLIVLFTK